MIEFREARRTAPRLGRVGQGLLFWGVLELQRWPPHVPKAPGPSDFRRGIYLTKARTTSASALPGGTRVKQLPLCTSMPTPCRALKCLAVAAQSKVGCRSLNDQMTL